LELVIGKPADNAAEYLIHNRKLKNCRITAAPAQIEGSRLRVSDETATRLGLAGGDSARAVSLSIPRNNKQAEQA